MPIQGERTVAVRPRVGKAGIHALKSGSDQGLNKWMMNTSTFLAEEKRLHREEGDNERGMSGESNSTKDVEKGAESERETRVRERV